MQIRLQIKLKIMNTLMKIIIANGDENNDELVMRITIIILMKIVIVLLIKILIRNIGKILMKNVMKVLMKMLMKESMNGKSINIVMKVYVK